MDCFNFASWCSGVSDYCGTSVGKGWGKGDCLAKKPPKGGKPPTTTTITVPCKPSATTTTTTSSTTTQCPIPTVTNICQQPTDGKTYGPGNPVGGVELPVLTCNDIKADFSLKPLKLYTDSDSTKCGGYPRNQVNNACSDACKAQYNNCVGTYAQGCKSANGVSGSSFWDLFTGFRQHKYREESSAMSGKSYFDYRNADPEKRGFFSYSDSYTTASNKCLTQYNDCLNTNRYVNIINKCSTYGTGW
jgi:hypothetical protein